MTIGAGALCRDDIAANRAGETRFVAVLKGQSPLACGTADVVEQIRLDQFCSSYNRPKSPP
jgi:hypothetical protein